MTYVSPDREDDSDLARRARAAAAATRRRLDALYALGRSLRGTDFGFVIRLRKSDLMRLSAADQSRLDRMLWDYRRQLPDEVRPKLPPFDPIVRELEMAGG